MLQVKHNKNVYKIDWKHVRRQDRPAVTHCFMEDSVGFMAHGEATCGNLDCFSRDFGRKEALKRAIGKSIPREELELRTKIWEKYRRMGKKKRW